MLYCFTYNQIFRKRDVIIIQYNTDNLSPPVHVELIIHLFVESTPVRLLCS